MFFILIFFVCYEVFCCVCMYACYGYNVCVNFLLFKVANKYLPLTNGH